MVIPGMLEWLGSCNNGMCKTIMTLDTDNFQDLTFGMAIMTHEYGHALDYLIGDKFFLQFDSRKFLISSLAEGTKIDNKAYQKLLTYGIVRSSYGRTSISSMELFAEAFGRWVMTPEQNRDLGWEKLDKFFRIDVLKMLQYAF